MIYWFSGAGNSRHVAQRLSALLSDPRLEAIGAALLDSPCPPLPAPGERVVWVFPVYSWGMPRPVIEAIARLAPGTSGDHYMVCTYGDDAGMTADQWRDCLRRAGVASRGAMGVQMPNTYTTLPGFDVDSPRLTSDKLAAAEGRIAEIAAMIERRFDATDLTTGSMKWLKSKVIYPFFMRWLTSPRPFVCDTALCTGCGACARACPMENIRLDDDRHPHWGSRCAMCLGCYHVCPVHAINYGRSTLHKGQYTYPRTGKYSD